MEANIKLLLNSQVYHAKYFHLFRILREGDARKVYSVVLIQVLFLYLYLSYQSESLEGG